MTKLMRRPFGGMTLYPTAFPTDVFGEFERFFDLDRFFRGLDVFNAGSQSLALRGFPRGDIFVKDGNLVMQFALAGYSKDQLEVQVCKEKNQIVVAGKKEEGDEDNQDGHSIARRSFRKVLSVLPEWNLDKVELSHVDGLLEIVVPPVEQVEPEPEPEPEYKTLEIK